MKANHLVAALAALVLGAAPARAEWSSCLSGLRAAAAGAGVSQQTIASATNGLAPNDAVSFMDKQPEFTTPVWDYVAGLVDEERVDEGRVMLHQHARALHAAESRYGVDAPTVVAVWGVESDFGKSFGKRPVVQSLATLACEAPRRNDYWRKEFIASLKVLDHGDIAPEEFYGSWAGAFGHTQFMPSTFLGMAVDLDGDGRRNIASSAAELARLDGELSAQERLALRNALGLRGALAGRLFRRIWPRASAIDGLLAVARRNAPRRRRPRRGDCGAAAARGAERTRVPGDEKFRRGLRLQRLQNLMRWRSASCPTGCAAGRAFRRHGRPTIRASRAPSAVNCKRF